MPVHESQRVQACHISSWSQLFPDVASFTETGDASGDTSFLNLPPVFPLSNNSEKYVFLLDTSRTGYAFFCYSYQITQFLLGATASPWSNFFLGLCNVIQLTNQHKHMAAQGTEPAEESAWWMGSRCRSIFAHGFACECSCAASRGKW